MGFGPFSSDSNSSSKKTTTVSDGRVANQSGSVSSINLNGLSASRSNIYLKLTDHGAINKALASNTSTVNKTIDAILKSDATNAQGYTKLLDLAGDFFGKATTTLQDSADKTLQGLSAIATAANDKEGQLDQKTIMILGACVVAGLWVFRRG